MLNIDLAREAIEYHYSKQPGAYNVGNPQPFVETYQETGINPFTDFNALMMKQPQPAITITQVVGAIPVVGESIRNQVQATAYVAEIIDNQNATWTVVLGNPVGAWNNLNNGTWFIGARSGGITAFDPLFTGTLEYIFYGIVTCYLAINKVPDLNYLIDLKYFNDLSPVNPIHSLILSKPFVAGTVDTVNFKSGGILVQNILIAGKGAISFDGYIFAVEKTS